MWRGVDNLDPVPINSLSYEMPLLCFVLAVILLVIMIPVVMYYG